MLLKLIRAHVKISGIVQGVFYRTNTVKEAKKRGLTGWVKNLPNGNVEAVFEGPEDKVKDMLKWCKEGPFLAVVKDIKVKYSEYKREFDNFERR